MFSECEIIIESITQKKSHKKKEKVKLRIDEKNFTKVWKGKIVYDLRGIHGSSHDKMKYITINFVLLLLNFISKWKKKSLLFIERDKKFCNKWWFDINDVFYAVGIGLFYAVNE